MSHLLTFLRGSRRKIGVLIGMIIGTTTLSGILTVDQTFSPSLDFSDARNSQYVPLIF